MTWNGCVSALWTTFLEKLDHWQSLAAGLVALLAAILAVFGAEFFARRKERRETEGIRVALAVEARRLMDTMIETHAVLINMVKIRKTSAIRNVGQIPAAELERARAGENTIGSIGRRLGELRKPVVYPACADRIGMLGRGLAEGVAGFYGNYEHLQFLGGVIFDDPRQAPSSPELARYAIAFEQACLNALPLFEELPIKGMREPLDLRDLKAKVEGMAKARAAQEDAPAA
jgi:hypothetical protein